MKVRDGIPEIKISNGRANETMSIFSSDGAQIFDLLTKKFEKKKIINFSFLFWDDCIILTSRLSRNSEFIFQENDEKKEQEEEEQSERGESPKNIIIFRIRRNH